MWMGGCFGAKNETSEVIKFSNTDRETLYLLLTKECRENPTSNSWFAARAIYERGY